MPRCVKETRDNNARIQGHTERQRDRMTASRSRAKGEMISKNAGADLEGTGSTVKESNLRVKLVNDLEIM